jgi:hypothetical protein
MDRRGKNYATFTSPTDIEDTCVEFMKARVHTDLASQDQINTFVDLFDNGPKPQRSSNGLL